MNKWFRLYRDPDPAAAGGGGAAPASAAGTVNLPAAGNGVTPPAFALPDAYKDKPYLKGVDSVDKVYAMLDGAQELIGKRPAGIPAADASPEEKAKFWEAVGKPKTAAEYKFDYGKDAQGNPLSAKDPVFEGKIKELMFKYDVPAAQAAGLQKDFEGMVAEFAKAKGIQEDQTNKDFDQIATKVYGAERDKILERVQGMIKEFAQPELAAGLSKLTPEALMIMSSVLNNVHAKYIKADGAPNGGAGANGGGNTPEARRAEAQRLMGLPEYMDTMHPGHKAINEKIQSLYRNP